MGILVIVLRALHIVGGVFWAGATIMLYGFVLPSVAATRPDSNRFVQYFANSSGYTRWVTIASIAALVGGLALFAPVTGSLDRDVMRSARGIALSLGALLGIGAFVEGQMILAPTGRRIGAIGRDIAAAGGTPTPAQAQELISLQAKLTRAGNRGAWMLGITVVLMAVARYL